MNRISSILTEPREQSPQSGHDWRGGHDQEWFRRGNAHHGTPVEVGGQGIGESVSGTLPGKGFSRRISPPELPHLLRTEMVLISRRLLPKRLRAKAIITYQRAMNWLRYGDANFPRAMCIEISVFCNRRCQYCPNYTNETPKIFMLDHMFDLVLRRLAEIRWHSIVDYNFYNEPTADVRLVEFVRKTCEGLPGALPRVITNGDYLTREYVLDLIRAGVVNFSISRHFPSNEAWDRRITALAREFRDYITVNHSWPRSDLSNRGGEVEIPGYKPISACDAPAVGLNILHNGDVIFCCCDYKRRHVFGNVQTSDLLTIWRSPEFAQERRNVGNGQPDYEICKQCFGRTL